MAARGLRSWILDYVPKWLSNRPGFNTGFNVIYTAALMLDIGLEHMVQGVRCWFPGMPVAPPGKAVVDWTSALPYAGRSRGIVQGLNESPQSFAARLVMWLQDWQNAGSSEVLAKQIQSYLGGSPPPTVRIVDRSGFWVSIDPSGNITTQTAPWNWDGDEPSRANWWSDLWIIVYPTQWPITGTQLSDLVGLWGTYNGSGTGHQVDRGSVGTILQLVAQWKGAHSYVEAIVWSYDPTLFVPGVPASGDPDGSWATWAKEVAGALVPARTGASDGRVRYWVPTLGG